MPQNHTFNPYLPIVVVGALLGGIVLPILPAGIHSLSSEFGIAGSVCYAAVLAIALSTDVRINKQIAHWCVQRPPDDWRLISARWIRFHIVRTFFHYRNGRATFLLVSSVNEARSMPAMLHFVSAAVSNLLGTTHEARPAIAPALRIVTHVTGRRHFCFELLRGAPSSP
jgi:hypothetical protein